MKPRSTPLIVFFLAVLFNYSIGQSAFANDTVSLKRMILNPHSSDDLSFEAVFSMYRLYDPSADWSDFINDNAHLGGVTETSKIKQSTPFFVPRKFCDMNTADGDATKVSVSYTSISRELNNVDSIPVSALFKMYSHRAKHFAKAQAEFSEFLACNPHIGDVSIDETVPWQGEEIILWSADPLDR